MKHTLVTIALCTVAVLGRGHWRGPLLAQGNTRPNAARPTTPRTGQQVYQAHCVECHGATGQGNGPAAHLLTPRPRDFSAGKYKIRSTESGSVPTDADLVRSVRQGLAGSAMPAWQGLLTDDDIGAVVGYINRCRRASPPIRPRSSRRARHRRDQRKR